MKTDDIHNGTISRDKQVRIKTDEEEIQKLEEGALFTAPR